MDKIQLNYSNVLKEMLDNFNRHKKTKCYSCDDIVCNDCRWSICNNCNNQCCQECFDIINEDNDNCFFVSLICEDCIKLKKRRLMMNGYVW